MDELYVCYPDIKDGVCAIDEGTDEDVTFSSILLADLQIEASMKNIANMLVSGDPLPLRMKVMNVDGEPALVPEDRAPLSAYTANGYTQYANINVYEEMYLLHCALRSKRRLLTENRGALSASDLLEPDRFAALKVSLLRLRCSSLEKEMEFVEQRIEGLLSGRPFPDRNHILNTIKE